MTKQTIYDSHLGKGGFLGADFSSAPTHTDPRRLCECINLWRDYGGEPGGYLESFPGFRRLASVGGRVHAMLGYRPPHDTAGRTYLLLHAGTKLWAAQTTAGESTLSPVQIATGLADTDSCLFTAGEQVGILDGTAYRLLTFTPSSGSFSVKAVCDDYIPLIYENGAALEQTNALSQKVREGWRLSYPPDYAIGTPGLMYEITSEVGQTCRVTGIAAPRRMIRIPSATVIADKTYRVTEIGDRAFQNDNTVETLWIDDGVGTLGRYAFNTCLGLVSVTLPDSVTTIGKGCFADCSLLSSLHFGQRTETIGPYAFYHCTALSGVTYTGTSEEWTAVKKEDKNEPLTALTPTCETPGNLRDCCLRLHLHGRCASLAAVTLDGTAVPPEQYSPTEDTVAAAGKVYYEKSGARYLEKTVTEGEALTGALYERHPLWYEAVTEGSGAEAVVTALLLYCDDIRQIYDRRVEATATLSQTSAEETPAVFGSASDTAAAVASCRCAASFDGRIFFTGSPKAPGAVFYSHRDRSGRNRPDYIGLCNFMRDGTGTVGNAAIAASADTLYVYKGGLCEEGAVFCHKGQDTGDDLLPRIYPSVSGVTGAYCVGCACNFADDPVFLTPAGLEATRAATVTAERSLLHRSGHVDARLTAEALEGARMIEWQGYLLILCPGGHIYMADSRRLGTSENGGREYEWFYLEGVGSYTGDYAVYRYASALPEGVVSLSLSSDGTPVTLSDDPDGLPFGDYGLYEANREKLLSLPMKAKGEDGSEKEITGVCLKETDESGFTVCHLLTQTEEKCGGTFSAATAGCAVGDRLLLGTAAGDVLSANTDLRTTFPLPDGTKLRRIPRSAYSICGHRYLCAAVTAADCGGMPHLTKDTRRDGTVIDTKALPGGRIRVRVRTDRENWKEAGIYTDGTLDFADLDLGVAVMSAGGLAQAVMRERTKRFAYKQYAFYSDEYRRPFGLGQVSYRFTVAGSIKNR